MQPTQALPVETWAQTLSQARVEQGLDIGTLARELMLSMAQIRGIEAGQTGAFHAQNYYLRGVQRYAERLQITLDPDPGTFQASDAASLRNRAPQRAQGIVQRQSSPADALQLPSGRSHGARLGRWLVILVVLLIGAGVYMAIGEGWPSKPIEDMVAGKSSNSSPGVGDQDQSSASAAAAESTGTAPATATQPASGTSVVTVNLGTAEIGTPSGTSSVAVPADASSGAPEQEIGNNAGTTLKPGAEHSDQGTRLTQNVTPSITGAMPDQASASLTQPIDSPNETDTQSSSPSDGASTQPLNQDSAVADEIVLRFNDDCWVELRRADGTSEQRIFNPGDEIRVAANEVDRLVLGNATAVQAIRAGKPFDVMQFTRGGTVARISGQALSQTAP